MINKPPPAIVNAIAWNNLVSASGGVFILLYTTWQSAFMEYFRRLPRPPAATVIGRRSSRCRSALRRPISNFFSRLSLLMASSITLVANSPPPPPLICPSSPAQFISRAGSALTSFAFLRSRRSLICVASLHFLPDVIKGSRAVIWLRRQQWRHPSPLNATDCSGFICKEPPAPSALFLLLPRFLSLSLK